LTLIREIRVRFQKSYISAWTSVVAAILIRIIAIFFAIFKNYRVVCKKVVQDSTAENGRLSPGTQLDVNLALLDFSEKPDKIL